MATGITFYKCKSDISLIGWRFIRGWFNCVQDEVLFHTDGLV